MIKDGEIIQIMSTCWNDLRAVELWDVLDNAEIKKSLNDWASFLRARELLSDNHESLIVSIKDNKIKGIW